jgi:hypothetical protein
MLGDGEKAFEKKLCNASKSPRKAWRSLETREVVVNCHKVGWETR